MGYFAVLKAPDNPRFKIIGCHLNFWVLNALGGYKYLLDVGLHIEAPADAALAGFLLAIPFPTDEDGFADISDVLTETHSATLIFGVPASHAQGIVTFEKDGKTSSLTLGRVLPHNAQDGSKRIEGAEFYSLWTLKLAQPIAAASSRYLRLRFDLRGVGRTWLWEKPGVLFDMRFADVREAVGVANLNSRKDDILEITALNLFLIAPTAFLLIRTEPDTHYIRLLESGVWRDYLGRKSSITGSQKLVIHQWRGTNVTVASPFRVYASMARHPFKLSATLWVLILTSVGFIYWPHFEAALADAAVRLTALGSWIWAIVAAGIATMAKIIKPIWSVATTHVPRWLKTLDSWLYK